jgi:hypothetical protein
MKVGMQVTIEHFDDNQRGGYALPIAKALFAVTAGFSSAGTVFQCSFGV